MYCSCPYAAKGYSCKHMAAVLYAAEEESSEKDDNVVFSSGKNLLTEKYSVQILKVYTEFVESLADAACNRSRYNELTGYLKRMKIYEGGEEIVSELAGKWMTVYPTRKVMVQELQAFV